MKGTTMAVPDYKQEIMAAVDRLDTGRTIACELERGAP
jgi:hypothetical protein